MGCGPDGAAERKLLLGSLPRMKDDLRRVCCMRQFVRKETREEPETCDVVLSLDMPIMPT